VGAGLLVPGSGCRVAGAGYGVFGDVRNLKPGTWNRFGEVPLPLYTYNAAGPRKVRGRLV